MKGLDVWFLAVSGAGMQAPITNWLIKYSPYISSLNKGITEIITLVVGIMGAFLLYRSIQLRTRNVRGVELDNRIKEKQLAEDNTDRIADRLKEKMKEDKPE